MTRPAPRALLAMWIAMGSTTASGTPETLLGPYRAAGAGPFSAERGAAAWNRKTGVEERSCSGCHGTDLKASGRHMKTGKTIGPLAPSVDPKRLSDTGEVEKWLLRNCRWTWGRECTPQEKGDFLQYIGSQ